MTPSPRRAWMKVEERSLMPRQIDKSRARVGDWVEAHGLPGQPSRHGQITEVLGRGAHRHYRVRWDEKHESILFPADGVTIHRHAAHETEH
jgi:Domain of unknown function (DUF1918)